LRLQMVSGGSNEKETTPRVLLLLPYIGLVLANLSAIQ
jgi:hypothetical protein